MKLISFKQVSGVDFISYIVEERIETIGYYHLALGFKSCEVVDDLAAEEGGTVIEGGFVDDDFGTFGFDALHHALDAGLAEVVAARLHCEAINADHALAFVITVEIAALIIVVIASLT